MSALGLKKKILVLVSGSGSNLQAIIDKCELGDINGVVVGVISNVPNVFALKRARRHNIPSIVVDHTHYKNRDDFDAALAKSASAFNADLVVLAGFMRILNESFVSDYYGKMLNIHPSLLPKYPGLHTHKRAIQNRDKVHGASVHFVNTELDGGPVVLQSIVEIGDDDSIEALQLKVINTEWQIYPLAVKWFCQEALRLQQDQVWFNNKVVHDTLKHLSISDFQLVIKNNNGTQYDEDIQ